MTPKTDKHARLKQWQPEAKTVLDRTTAAARTIIDDEARHRAEKTERLKAARLEQAQPEALPAETMAKKHQ